jgi:hypothetical protein
MKQTDELSRIIAQETNQGELSKIDIDGAKAEGCEEPMHHKYISFPSQLLEDESTSQALIGDNRERENSVILIDGEVPPPTGGDTLLLDSQSIILDTGGDALRADQSFDTSNIKDFLSSANALGAQNNQFNQI